MTMETAESAVQGRPPAEAEEEDPHVFIRLVVLRQEAVEIANVPAEAGANRATDRLPGRSKKGHSGKGRLASGFRAEEPLEFRPSQEVGLNRSATTSAYRAPVASADRRSFNSGGRA